MTVTSDDLRSGRVDLTRLALERGGWLGTQCGPDPQADPDFDTDPPVQHKFVPGELRAADHTVESRSRVHAQGATKGGCDARLPAPTRQGEAT